MEAQEAAVDSAMAHYESMGDAAHYGTDAISSSSLVAPGNAARLGEWIQQEVGGDLSATIRDLKAALPDSATVLEPLGVYRADILGAQPQVQAWLKDLGFTE